ncbi:FAD-dependent monooxygenase [Paenibacillus hunanensis]|uniref:2-polyprenyl-6-methoxyphenol hydroxylase-like FAD-dependent oxidoreductase n=1 Tax=Paenibacillus hunanensis TaxID=539262 RepID=A0ABU1J143_9BACL|nr:FAD-dependent monooxygenase [Paenibacillus hunanensis]MDR6244208.1 2-polyprenyl-6-methoxyphenol hydroxylase-like FAD-dependent oxidoreductase [Paenibacillus hunanensis]GGJ18598.1 FAD-binding monooxygenase [Paenibacillus hunanensis]
MNVRKALISGASIAGLSTAFWLSKAGWEVSIIERASAFRDGGQNVDVRGIAREVLQKMGLEDQVRQQTTTEEGTAFINEKGQVVGAFPVEDSDGMTAELEILRGDLARIVLEALPSTIDIRYGDWIEHVSNGTDHVDIQLHSGQTETYDLLIIAEGIRSRTRDQVFGDRVARNELGLNIAYGTIEREAGDDRWWRWYTATGGRQISLRPDNQGTIRAMLAFKDNKHNLASLPTEQALAELKVIFTGAGWQDKRVIEGFATSKDVYFDYLTQIKMSTYSEGRVCVTGDAAWCVTPIGGGGSSLALIGGYVLAAFLSQAESNVVDSIESSLTQYEHWMRPMVDKAQSLPPGTPDLFYPQTKVGVGTMQTFIRIASFGPFRKLASRIGHVARTKQELPEIQMVQATP